MKTSGIVPGIEEQGIEGTLRYAKEVVWSYLKGLCSLFRIRNCCAQF